jgi:hypothetical protein
MGRDRFMNGKTTSQSLLIEVKTGIKKTKVLPINLVLLLTAKKKMVNGVKTNQLDFRW